MVTIPTMLEVQDGIYDDEPSPRRWEITDAGREVLNGGGS